MGAGGGWGQGGWERPARSGVEGEAGHPRTCANQQFMATDLATPLTVTVGAGRGGVSVSTADTNGNFGIQGGDSSFGRYLVASGGFGGAGHVRRSRQGAIHRQRHVSGRSWRCRRGSLRPSRPDLQT
jgi:hypothetical protein